MIHATGSQIILKLLEMKGIRIVSGIPGGQILPLYDELKRSSSIRHILVRHEQAAGFIAQGIARSTGLPAVCLATSGPGAMNLLTAIADARCDSIPIVAITGQVNTTLIGTDAFQEADTFGLSFPITKHSILVKSAYELLKAVPLAFDLAVTGRAGPVLLDVPRDVQCEEVEFEAWPEVLSFYDEKKSFLEMKKSLKPKFYALESEIKSTTEKMAKVLCEAKRPVLYIGGGCNSIEASNAINEMLNLFDIPVVSSLMGIGAVSKKHPNNIGMVGMHGSFAANKAMKDADVVLALGVRFDDRATGKISSFCPNALILHIDIDAAEVNKILSASLLLICYIEEALPLLVSYISKDRNKSSSERKKWLSSLKKIFLETESTELGRKKESSYPNPREFIRDIPEKALLSGLLSKDIIVTTDVGQHQMWAAQFYPVEYPRQFLTSGSLGTMGFGLPSAIGASLSFPNKKVVCISGDGSIMMNLQELATLSELSLNVTVIVIENGVLGMVRQQQEYLFEGNFSASEFIKNPDLLKIADGFGLESIDANLDCDWHLKAFKTGPKFVRLKISADENVLPFVKSGSANIDAIRN